MSYEINDDGLFSSLTSEEASDLEQFCSDLVLKGVTQVRHPAFQAFAATFPSIDESRWLILYATAFPQRALLSLLRRGKASSEPRNLSVL